MASAMSRRLIWAGVAVVATGAMGFGLWMLSLPPTPVAGEAPPIARQEVDAMLDGLKPPKRARPLIAIVGINDATEVTDYLMPFGILRRSDVADVTLLATGPGPVTLFPALTVEPHATIAAFDTQHPDGADYVLVPAMSRDDDPAVLEWLRAQAGKGATIVGVCAGAKVVGAAGLLDGRRATTHWYYVEELLDESPSIQYVPDRRIVVDGAVATTTGITASMPVALTLIEAIAGHDKAAAVAQEIGLTHWDARHDGEAFQFTRPFASTAFVNTIAFWNRETLGIELAPGLDEVSLALVADAWSRTFRSHALTFSPAGQPVQSRNGVRVVPDRVVATWPEATWLPSPADRPPVSALNDALAAIAARYGDRTMQLVAMQLEYPRSNGAAAAVADPRRELDAQTPAHHVAAAAQPPSMQGFR